MGRGEGSRGRFGAPGRGGIWRRGTNTVRHGLARSDGGGPPRGVPLGLARVRCAYGFVVGPASTGGGADSRGFHAEERGPLRERARRRASRRDRDRANDERFGTDLGPASLTEAGPTSFDPTPRLRRDGRWGHAEPIRRDPRHPRDRRSPFVVPASRSGSSRRRRSAGPSGLSRSRPRNAVAATSVRRSPRTSASKAVRRSDRDASIARTLRTGTSPGSAAPREPSRAAGPPERAPAHSQPERRLRDLQKRRSSVGRSHTELSCEEQPPQLPSTFRIGESRSPRPRRSRPPQRLAPDWLAASDLDLVVPPSEAKRPGVPSIGHHRSRFFFSAGSSPPAAVAAPRGHATFRHAERRMTHRLPTSEAPRDRVRIGASHPALGEWHAGCPVAPVHPHARISRRRQCFRSRNSSPAK